jgi:hypothetical protein
MFCRTRWANECVAIDARWDFIKTGLLRSGAGSYSKRGTIRYVLTYVRLFCAALPLEISVR